MLEQYKSYQFKDNHNPTLKDKNNLDKLNKLLYTPPNRLACTKETIQEYDNELEKYKKLLGGLIKKLNKPLQ